MPAAPSSGTSHSSLASAGCLCCPAAPMDSVTGLLRAFWQTDLIWRCHSGGNSRLVSRGWPSPIMAGFQLTEMQPCPVSHFSGHVPPTPQSFRLLLSRVQPGSDIIASDYASAFTQISVSPGGYCDFINPTVEEAKAGFSFSFVGSYYVFNQKPYFN